MQRIVVKLVVGMFCEGFGRSLFGTYFRVGECVFVFRVVLIQYVFFSRVREQLCLMDMFFLFVDIQGVYGSFGVMLEVFVNFGGLSWVLRIEVLFSGYFDYYCRFQVFLGLGLYQSRQERCFQGGIRGMEVVLAWTLSKVVRVVFFLFMGDGSVVFVIFFCVEMVLFAYLFCD